MRLHDLRLTFWLLSLALKWFPNGAGSEPEAYEGGRDLEALAELCVDVLFLPASGLSSDLLSAPFFVDVHARFQNLIRLPRPPSLDRFQHIKESRRQVRDQGPTTARVPSARYRYLPRRRHGPQEGRPRRVHCTVVRALQEHEALP